MNRHLTLMGIFMVVAGLSFIESIQQDKPYLLFLFVIGFVGSLRSYLKWKEGETKLHD